MMMCIARDRANPRQVTEARTGAFPFTVRLQKWKQDAPFCQIDYQKVGESDNAQKGLYLAPQLLPFSAGSNQIMNGNDK
jgi:hypothetical protein